ncbi:MAG: AmmeMemoRadiSam system protein B [Chloroflexia bacterium]|nr:AmmeMemoRadiSam system protein B [Chloroflexia bacterium]
MAEKIPTAKIRPSPIAGTWYPGTAQKLGQTLDQFLKAPPEQSLPGQIVALVAPHAGYAYSGQVAAYAYKQVQGKRYERIVVLSPAHRPNPGHFQVTTKQYYQTPLGLVEVDLPTLAQLEKSLPLHRLQYDDEHSLEIQLPFLQRTVGEFLLVPIMMRDQTWQDCQDLAAALQGELGDAQPLLVASTDLCHAHSYERVRQTDASTLAALQQGDPRQFWQTAQSQQGACGYGPVTVALLLAQRWGAKEVVLLHHTNSADVTGQREGYVVGYAAAALVKPATVD